MKLEFNQDINEFANGNFIVENKGKPFEVTDAEGRLLLKAKLNGEAVFKAFENVVHTEKELNKMLKDDLIDIATAKDIELSGKETNAELAELILEVQKESDK